MTLTADSLNSTIQVPKVKNGDWEDSLGLYLHFITY